MQKYRIDYYSGTATSTDLLDRQYLRFKNETVAKEYAHEHAPAHSYPEVMKVKEPVMTEPMPQDIDMQKFHERFTDNYEYLYDNNNMVEEYSEALDAGDRSADRNGRQPEFYLSVQCVSRRVPYK